MNNSFYSWVRAVCSALVIACLCSCISTPKTPVVKLQIDEPQRIRFSGKGAGAGVMLMSSMGPMGIAVGVAIDEGIAKTLQEQFTAKGHSLDSLVDVAAKEALSQSSVKINIPILIHLSRIGIKMAGGENVVADLEGTISVGDIAKPLLVTPDEKSATAQPITLDHLKVDGDLTYTLLKEALIKSIRTAVQS